MSVCAMMISVVSNFLLLVTIMLSGEQKTKVELVLFDVHVDTIYYLHVCNHIIPNLDYCKHVQILILIKSFQIICITLLTIDDCLTL